GAVCLAAIARRDGLVPTAAPAVTAPGHAHEPQAARDHGDRDQMTRRNTHFRYLSSGQGSGAGWSGGCPCVDRTTARRRACPTPSSIAPRNAVRSTWAVHDAATRSP